MADDSKQMDFDTIIWELQRIEDLQQKQEEIQEELSETTEEVEEVKVSTEDVEKVIGIKESDKKKNVIDGDKLSTTLTTSEKKRYENIGKEFIAGAGKELENVRKAVEFKDSMSTVRNKFSEGVVKFKEGVKKSQKVGSFFGKLMIIIGLLGTIVMLFKDKILSFFPNIGEKITGFFETAKLAMPKILGSVLSYVTTSIGGSFQTILEEVVKLMPSLIGTFFGVTLPDAIVTLYVGILSAFSSKASQMYDQRLGAMINSDAETLAEAGEVEIKQQGLIDSYATAWERVNAGGVNSTYRDMNESQRGASVLAMMQNNASRDVLNYLETLTQGDTKIEELIKSGQFNAASFLNAINEANADGNVTNNEVLQAIRASISQELLDTGNFVLSSGIDGDAASDFSKALLEMHGNAVSRRNSLNDLMDNKRQQESSQANVINGYRRRITNINADNVISEVLAETFKTLTQTIATFLSGNTIADALKSSFQQLNVRFNEFFGKFNGFVDEAFKSVGLSVSQLAEYCLGVQASLYNNNQQEDITLDTDDLSMDSDESKPFTPYFNFNAIINVQIPQNDSSEAISNIVRDVVSIDETLTQVMQNSNSIMYDVISNFSNIHNLHAYNKEYIDGEIEKRCNPLDQHILTITSHVGTNRQKIDEIERIVVTPVGRPRINSSMSPCLDVS